ncbi:MAG: arginine--tRNA ligase, partial [Pseudomonadota bacterium]
RSAHLRYRQALGEEVGEIPAGLYPGDYLIEVGETLAQRHGDAFRDAPEDAWLAIFRDEATDLIMATIRADLASLGVEMDVYFSEKSLYGTGRIEQTLAALDDKGLIYEGVLEPPKGKKIEDWEPRPQTLFRSSSYGDDTDRPIKKADGAWTYFAPDIAYHKDKIDRGFDLLIDVLGADHGGYVKRMAAAVAALSERKTGFEAKLCQLVRLFKNGEPFKMSKRAGTFVTLRDVLDEVGADVTRFVMLMRKNDAPLDFDFTAALEQSRENPVWYVQYANARVVSVETKANQAGIKAPAQSEVEHLATKLCHVAEIALMAKISSFPRVVEAASFHHEPHRVAFYLYDLAAEFHSYWNKGTDEPALRVVNPDEIEMSQARLCLARAVGVVIGNGLGVLGVTPMSELR